MEKEDTGAVMTLLILLAFREIMWSLIIEE